MRIVFGLVSVIALSIPAVSVAQSLTGACLPSISVRAAVKDPQKRVCVESLVQAGSVNVGTIDQRCRTNIAMMTQQGAFGNFGAISQSGGNSSMNAVQGAMGGGHHQQILRSLPVCP